MENAISHDGVVEAITEGHVQVRIVQTSACAACKVASHCTTAEAREKLVDVEVADTERWHIGQQVVVTTAGSMAGRALLLGFGLPLALMLVALAAALAAGCSEAAAALTMLAVLVPYYALLWLFRGRIAQKISFRLQG